MDWISLHEALEDVRKLAGNAFEVFPCTLGKYADSVMYEHLPASVYHADRDALSCSLLKPLLISPAHFQAALLAPHQRSDAKDFGTLVHLHLLEPQNLGQEVAVYPGAASARDRDYKTFAASNTHRLVVDEPTFAAARMIAAKVGSSRYRGRPLSRFIEEGMPECSIYFTEPITSLRLRVRFDLYHPEVSFDLKTTRRATAAEFARDAVALSYDLQAYMYSLARSQFEGVNKAAPFVFISAETGAPHAVCTHLAGASFLENGGAKLRECLTIFQACTKVQLWPDLSCHTTLEILPWQQYEPGREWRTAESD